MSHERTLTVKVLPGTICISKGFVSPAIITMLIYSQLLGNCLQAQ